jgi:hypothetical protein
MPSEKPVTFQDYHEQWYLSVAFGAPYRPAEHDRLKTLLSPAGLVVVLIAACLEQVPDEFGERYYYFQPEPVQPERDIMATAVETVGATALAQWLRIPIPRPLARPFLATTPASSPQLAGTVETHDELRSLLTAFVAANQTDLTADHLRLPDRRTEPGFRPGKAKRDAEKRDDIAAQVYRLQTRLPELQNLTMVLAEAIAHQPKAASTRSQARRLKGIIAPIRTGDRSYFPADVRDWLEQLEQTLAGQG